MEEDVLGARGVLEYGEDCGHGATDVGGVKGHCHVDSVIGAHGVVVFIRVDFAVVFGISGDGGAVRRVVELGSFSKLLAGDIFGCGG